MPNIIRLFSTTRESFHRPSFCCDNRLVPASNEHDSAVSDVRFSYGRSND